MQVDTFLGNLFCIVKINRANKKTAIHITTDKLLKYPSPL